MALITAITAAARTVGSAVSPLLAPVAVLVAASTLANFVAPIASRSGEALADYLYGPRKDETPVIDTAGNSQPGLRVVDNTTAA